MKEQFLKFLYKRYRRYFYSFFVEEMIGDIPESISEPSLTFLANGRDKLTRWAYYWVHLIQARIVTDPKEIATQQGMILMLKIFINLVKRQPLPRAEERGEPEEEPRDYAKEVEDTISQYRQERKKK